jgi:hypothetical protein
MTMAPNSKSRQQRRKEAREVAKGRVAGTITIERVAPPPVMRAISLAPRARHELRYLLPLALASFGAGRRS